MPEPNESLMTALADFAAGAGHEINNPLAIISGHAQILLEKAQTPEQRRRLAAIIAQTKRAYEMIADIRLFACPPEPHRTYFNIFSFFDELVAGYASPNSEFPIPIRIKRAGDSDGTANVFCDRQILRMVFDALLQNAFEAAKNKTPLIEITPSFHSEESCWQILVADNGPGIGAEERERVFFPYYSGRDAGRGLGFGLPRSWALMKKMGGKLALEEHGFVVTLPPAEATRTS